MQRFSAVDDEFFCGMADLRTGRAYQRQKASPT